VNEGTAKAQSALTPERWQRLREMLLEALQLESAQRAAFLDRVCGSDDSLRSEIETLIAANDELRTSFLNSPPTVPATRLEEGTRFGDYEIERLIGAGGMGEVYRARDINLRRDVAIKVLPAFFSSDRERLWRFEQEAQAAAALNHPNILSIFQLGSHEARPYLVSELLEGQTLREQLKRGPIPLRRSIELAVQLARGLTAAHDKGIVHRDLKPENLFVTKDSRLKILDFGLAKLIEPKTIGQSFPTQDVKTGAGVILGTMGYMSPEQVRGRETDNRTDLFAFGLILYEMLTGMPAFPGATSADKISAILHGDPPALSEVVPSAPPALQRIVQRCLEKSPDQRFQSASDLAFALEALTDLPSETRKTSFVATTSRPRHTAVVVLAFLLSAAVVAGVVWKFRSSKTNVGVRDYEILPIATYPGNEIEPSLSPDGSQVAYAWEGSPPQKFHIFVKSIGAGSPLQITKAEFNDSGPAWSPDGGYIAFLRDIGQQHFEIRLIPPLGGPERKITEIYLPDKEWIGGPYLSWTPDSSGLLFSDWTVDKTSALFLLTLDSGQKRQVTFPPPATLGDAAGNYSPDAHKLAFTRAVRLGSWGVDLYTVPVGADFVPSSQPQKVNPDPLSWIQGMTWNRESSALIFSRYRESGKAGLMTLPVPNPSHEAPRDLQMGVASWPTIARHSARLAFARGSGGGLTIWRLQLQGDQVVTAQNALIESTRADFAPRYSPDGKHIAFESGRSGNLEIWTCNDSGEECTQVSSLGHEYTGTPAWSPDGTHLAFYSRVDNKPQVFVIGSDGTGLSQLTSGAASHFFPSWSHDGHWIYVAQDSNGKNQIFKVPSEGGTPTQVTRNGGFAARESADGKWLYYTKSEAEDTSLWKVPVDGGEETQVLPSVHFHNFDVTPSGIYFFSDATTLKFLNPAGQIKTLATNLAAGYVGLSVAPDEKSILFTISPPGKSELLMVKDFQ
jgi:eukaryotic-like serine/threonine-protein kinase